MKKSVILSAILFSGLVYNTAKAQISIHVGLNLPTRHVVYVPAPQPVETVYDDDFDNSDDYYYLPEVEAYFSISLNRYFYYNDNRWVSAAYLPGAYRNYDWRTARRFEVRGSRPYMNHNVYRNKWGGNGNRDWNRGDNNYAGRNDHNSGNWGGNQPSRNNSYNHANRDDNHGRGNWGRGQSQPSQPGQNGGQNQNSHGRDRGQSQPSNNNGGGHDRGNNGGGQVAHNQNPRQSGFARPRL